jgi:hypothetical protein
MRGLIELSCHLLDTPYSACFDISILRSPTSEPRGRYGLTSTCSYIPFVIIIPPGLEPSLLSGRHACAFELSTESEPMRIDNGFIETS